MVEVCLGTLAVPSRAGEAGQSEAEPPRPAVKDARRGALPLDLVAHTGGGIEAYIMEWYAKQMAPAEVKTRRIVTLPLPPIGESALASDPAGVFFVAFTEGRLPKDIEGRTRAVREALATKQCSMAFAALLWRALAEQCLDGPAPDERSEGKRELLRETLLALHDAARGWRSEIFEKKLDPFLARGRIHSYYGFEMSKAQRRLPWLDLARDTAAERWTGGRRVRKTKDLEPLEGYLGRHPIGEVLQVDIFVDESARVTLLDKNGARPAKGEFSLGIFDILRTPKDVTTSVTVKAPRPGKLKVELPGGREFTYADILRLTDEQHREITDYMIRPYGPKPPMPTLLQAARRALDEPQRDLEAKVRRHRAAAWLADFWMF